MESRTPANILKTLTVIHWAIVAIPVVFSGVVYFLISSTHEVMFMDTANPLTYVPIAMLVLAIPISSFVFKNFLNQNVKKDAELFIKLGSYQAAHLVRVAVLEAAALMAVVSCFVTYTTINFITFGIALVFMIMAAPSAFKITEHLNLSPEEVKQLEHRG